MALAIKEFVVKQNLDGINLSWTSNKSFNEKEYVIVRRQYGFPISPNDGTIIYRGKDTSTLDKNVVTGRLYYYRLYATINNGSLDTDYLSDEICKKSLMAITLGSYGDKLYNRLPNFYRIEDDKLNQNRPLLRFLKIIGYQYDKLEVYINNILTNIDIDNCDARFLEVISAFVGVEYDRSISIDENRRILKLMIEGYKYKGTAYGMERLLQNISKANVQVNVNKTPTLKTDSKDKIRDRRTVDIIMQLIEDKSDWVNSRRAKIIDLIKSQLPLGYKPRLVIETSYYEDMKSDRNDKTSFDGLITNYRDAFGALDDNWHNKEDKLNLRGFNNELRPKILRGNVILTDEKFPILDNVPFEIVDILNKNTKNEKLLDYLTLVSERDIYDGIYSDSFSVLDLNRLRGKGLRPEIFRGFDDISSNIVYPYDEIIYKTEKDTYLENINDNKDNTQFETNYNNDKYEVDINERTVGDEFTISLESDIYETPSTFDSSEINNDEINYKLERDIYANIMKDNSNDVITYIDITTKARGFTQKTNINYRSRLLRGATGWNKESITVVTN